MSNNNFLHENMHVMFLCRYTEHYPGSLSSWKTWKTDQVFEVMENHRNQKLNEAFTNLNVYFSVVIMLLLCFSVQALVLLYFPPHSQTFCVEACFYSWH